MIYRIDALTHLLRRFMAAALTGLFVIQSSCIATKFAPTESSPQNLSPYGNRVIYTITCQAERDSGKAVNLTRSASKYVYRVSPSCEGQQVDVSEDLSHKPINIVIVMDRTGSMGSSIAGVKAGIFDMARQMERHGWDAHFAAVGFRDFPNDFIITPFASAKTMAGFLEKWRAEGGDDPQEAGQLALETAADLLDTYVREKPARRDAMNVLLYISDAVAYRGLDHNDFTVDELANLARKWNARFHDFRIYYSVPKDVDPMKEWGLDAPAPHKQLDSLLEKSKVNGKGFGFPVTPAILSEFAKEFSSVTVTDVMICAADSAVFETAPGATTPEREEKEGILDILTNGQALEFRVSPDPLVNDYQLKVTRCCRSKKNFDASTECKTRESSTFNFFFNQAKQPSTLPANTAP